MEFESPDVEKDFPGLYGSESGKKSNESDFSDDAHDKPSKKELLIGKRKDKKDSKKDRGYAALEGESSPEEDVELKSPSKSKKSKPFKFPSKKEKREKSREKESKDVDKEKKKEKETKVKLKLKERKKSKHDESNEVKGEHPIFSVPLALAIERNRCHDGVEIPLIVRDCIDYIQESGLTMEFVYKISGMKSKVLHLRKLYNNREFVKMSDYEIPVATSLLKQFFRELPESVLTTDLLPRFEEAASAKEPVVKDIQEMLSLLPHGNRLVLAWVLLHLEAITSCEKQNKMSLQNIASILGPILQMSQRLITIMVSNSKVLFPDVKLFKYIPPLTAGSPSLPESPTAIAKELKKQESLLNQIHQEMNAGFVSKTREEQLWEVQRMLTQLKRKLRTIQRSSECSVQKSMEEDPKIEQELLNTNLQKVSSCSEDDASSVPEEPPKSNIISVDQEKVDTCDVIQTAPIQQSEPMQLPSELSDNKPEQEDIMKSEDPDSNNKEKVEDTLQAEDAVDSVDLNTGKTNEEPDLTMEIRKEMYLQKEIRNLYSDLLARLNEEKLSIAKILTQLRDMNLRSTQNDLNSTQTVTEEGNKEEIIELNKENLILEKKKNSLINYIMKERENCLTLQCEIKLLEESQEH